MNRPQSHRQVVSPQMAPPPAPRKSNRRLFAIVAILAIAGLGFTTFYFWQKYRAIIKNPNIVAQEEAKAITEKIKKFMDLPEDETPDLAKVSNKEKLAGQPFFQKSQNGDVVLIYLKAKKAILYRPSTNRVIDMVPLSDTEIPEPAPENPEEQK